MRDGCSTSFDRFPVAPKHGAQERVKPAMPQFGPWDGTPGASQVLLDVFCFAAGAAFKA